MKTWHFYKKKNVNHGNDNIEMSIMESSHIYEIDQEDDSSEKNNALNQETKDIVDNNALNEEEFDMELESERGEGLMNDEFDQPSQIALYSNFVSYLQEPVRQLRDKHMAVSFQHFFFF